jgi:hypothetical protein
MLWPVYGFRDHQRETVALFFKWGDAVDFVHYSGVLGFEERMLYIGEARHDSRASGHRFICVEHDWIDATTLEDKARRFICARCPATK